MCRRFLILGFLFLILPFTFANAKEYKALICWGFLNKTPVVCGMPRLEKDIVKIYNQMLKDDPDAFYEYNRIDMPVHIVYERNNVDEYKKYSCYTIPEPNDDCEK